MRTCWELSIDDQLFATIWQEQKKFVAYWQWQYHNGEPIAHNTLDAAQLYAEQVVLVHIEAQAEALRYLSATAGKLLARMSDSGEIGALP